MNGNSRRLAFRRLTGISVTAFRKLVVQVQAAADAARERLAEKPGRLRKPGAGRKHVLPLEERLRMLLIYYRTYVPMVFLGDLFGVDAATVCRNISVLEPLLAGIFRIPERKPVLQENELRELFVDGTEQPTNRPKRGQKPYYSGKKKRHTLKHQVVVVRVKKRPGPGPQRRRVRIAAVSPLFRGSTHDKKMYDKTRMRLPPNAKKFGDTAYIGTELTTPKRRPRKGELTPREMARNRNISRRRIVAEHGIGKMKIWRIAAERYRNPHRRHTLMYKNVAGLHNLMYA